MTAQIPYQSKRLSIKKAACKHLQAVFKTLSHQSADNTVTTVASLPLLLTLTRVVPP